jgi:hypothetical protein
VRGNRTSGWPLSYTSLLSPLRDRVPLTAGLALTVVVFQRPQVNRENSFTVDLHPEVNLQRERQSRPFRLDCLGRPALVGIEVGAELLLSIAEGADQDA